MSDPCNKPPFTVLEHSGDLRFLARGTSLLEALANASQGMMSQIVDLSLVNEQERQTLDVTGEDDVERSVAFLNELLYLAYTKRWLPKRVQILSHCYRKACREFSAVLAGEPLDSNRHKFKYEIKAVTYHDFTIREDAGVWTIEFVCDL